MPSDRALLIVIDGLGFNRETTARIAAETWDRLDGAERSQLTAAARTAAGGSDTGSHDVEALARLALYPVDAETLDEEMPFNTAVATLAALRRMSAHISGTLLQTRMEEVRGQAARDHRYVPWIAADQGMRSLRNNHLTIPTSASGVWAGFEELDPPVQGNSDTGHQQIGNLSLAPQIPLEITRSIEDGSFFENEALRGTVEPAIKSGRTVNFCFMVSGTAGNDGRVHSAWNHLEAFLELVFTHLGAKPSQVRMQAILDGRDCPARSSLEEINGVGDYIGLLERLLERYQAKESLAWVVGRSTAMDRDYREPNARADYLLLTRAEGQQVHGFDGVRAAVEQAHRTGKTDQDVPPIVVLDAAGRPRTIESDQAFVNLNFRSDRQRSKTASLLGARAFLKKESESRGRSWGLEWLNDSLQLELCAIAEYHPVFEREHGARVAFPARPHQDNLLAMWPQLLPGERYLLVAESVKSSHMGYFIRGRREGPADPSCEERTIVPSHGEADGVVTDTDFYRQPQMRNPEVAAAVIEALSQARHRLICANLAATDMVGHLLPDRFEAAIQAHEATDRAVTAMAEAAMSNGYSVVITADHGNIEDDSPSHSLNDILTTVIGEQRNGPKAGRLVPETRAAFQARLFDMGSTLARLLGVAGQLPEVRQRHALRRSPGDRFEGRPLVSEP